MKRLISICALAMAFAVNDGCASAEKQVRKPIQITTIWEDRFIGGEHDIELYSLRENAQINPDELGRLCYIAEIEGGKYTELHSLRGYDCNNDQTIDAVMIFDERDNLIDVGLNRKSVVYPALKEKLRDKLVVHETQED
jgi:hypothetical protein